ncbi:P-loop containing nucleoside triphosphate hydrolase protein [Boletus reticuloceps]|uniref:P-loop containing nucleoside triphosphate hydrolase protein n=1 Tax=Boletus reticuloceps TaxID=495285 RepID=A0A8I3A4E5_9AGAM|nr:P-loop containing nucleoside triphosphate hydrolase protein [Boletus reticuloceps]
MFTDDLVGKFAASTDPRAGSATVLKASAMHRNSTFIGIRNYFRSLSRQAKPTVYDSRPRPHCAQGLSSSATSCAAAVRPKSSQYELPTDVYFSENSPLAPSTRFDWRLRATSRCHPRHDSLGKRDGVQAYMKRVIPSCIEVQPSEPLYEEIQAYRDQCVRFFIDKHCLVPSNSHSFLPLLNAEQAEDESVLRDRLSSWSLSRLREAGYTVTDLYAFWIEAPQIRNPIACFSLGPGIILPEHRFGNGTQVLLSRVDPLQEVPLRGTVLASNATQLRIVFDQQFDVEDGQWRLDVGRSNIVFERMRSAISHFNHDPVVLDASRSPDRQFVIQGTHLRHVLLRSFSPASTSLHQPLQAPDEVEYVSRGTLEHQSRDGHEHGGAFKDDMRIQSWARRYAHSDPIRMDGDPVLDGLNETQIQAVATMIGERISLVQGPPGTGKTKTIVEAVKVLKAHFEVHHPILVCAYTNAAVDNLVEGFAGAHLKPLRVGFRGKIRDSLTKHTLDYKLDQHPLKSKVDKVLGEKGVIEKKRLDLTKRIEAIQRAPTTRAAGRLDQMRSALLAQERQSMAISARLYAIHQEMLRDITADADVICTTCITSASVALNVLDFPVVFLDEASMSTEPASLIPLMKGAQHVALIGDHKQLPPVIASREAQLKGLGTSLFERLTEEGVVPSIMLDVQYRMHPSISQFPSLEFYNLSLRDGTVDALGNISPNLLPPLSSHLPVDELTGYQMPVVFLDHGGSETAKDRSRVNWNEAQIVCSVVEDLLLKNEYLRGEDVGIIAPYVAQVSLLTRLLNSDEKYRKRFSTTLGDHRKLQLHNIDIKTVDGFEGREKEVIIFSTVRNNPSGQIGFLADRRRLNVGLTRAKRGLFIIGSISTLKESKVTKGRSGKADFVPTPCGGRGSEAWKRYTQYLVEQRMVLQLTGDRLHKALYGNMRVPLGVYDIPYLH